MTTSERLMAPLYDHQLSGYSAGRSHKDHQQSRHPSKHQRPRWSDDESTLAKVKTAIGTLKNGKALGVDAITAESIKAGGDVLLQQVHLLPQKNVAHRDDSKNMGEGHHYPNLQERQQPRMPKRMRHQSALDQWKSLHESNSIMPAETSRTDEPQRASRLQISPRVL